MLFAALERVVSGKNGVTLWAVAKIFYHEITAIFIINSSISNALNAFIVQ